MNWSRWATSGCIPGISTVHFIDTGMSVDELEAAETEAALMVMRVERTSEYRLARMVYLKRWNIPTCCEALAGRRHRSGKRRWSISRAEYYRRLLTMYKVLRNTLARVDNSETKGVKKAQGVDS